MRDVATIFLLLFMTLLLTSPAAFATSADTSSFKILVRVTETMATKNCQIGFENNKISLAQSTNNNCHIDSQRLKQEAMTLATERVQLNGMLQLVTITVTAP